MDILQAPKTLSRNWKYFLLFKKIGNIFEFLRKLKMFFDFSREPCVFSTIGTPVSISRHLSLKSKNIPPRTLLSHSQQLVNQLMN